MNEWLVAHPDGGHDEMIARLRSRDGIPFRSAFWEMYVFSILRNRGRSEDLGATLAGSTG